MAPAGSAISMIGSMSAVCTSATCPAEDIIWVAQAAPTPCIRMSRLVSKLASQIVGWRNRAINAVAAGGQRFGLVCHLGSCLALMADDSQSDLSAWKFASALLSSSALRPLRLKGL